VRTLNLESLDKLSDATSKPYPLRLLVPHILIGPIIGKSGVRIREIQDASGARLNVSDSCLPLSTERSLVVLGVADSAHIAAYYIAQTLSEQLTERYGGPAASAYATRAGGPAAAVPGGMQVVPYIPQPVGGTYGHLDAYKRQNQHTNMRAVSNPYPSGFPSTSVPPNMAHPVGYGANPAAQAHNPYGAPQHLGAHHHQAAAAAGPHGAQGIPNAAAVAAAAAAAGAAAPVTPTGHGLPGQGITQQIFIPNDMVGAIIGKGGAKINEIRQLSGSVIKINEPQDNSNERLVTITGTAESNHMALYMLYSRLGT
jgi:heterogeneous nuclear rnp K-like protein 2